MRRHQGKWLGLLLAVGMAAGQTRVSIKNQGKEYDFSQGARVRPFTVTTTLPSTCQTGEMRFRTDVTPGQNLYGCAGSNLWMPMGVSLPVFDPGVRLDRSGPTQLTIGSDCTLSKACLFRFGSIVSTVVAPGTLTLSGGDGQIFVYITTAGQFGVAMTPTSSLSLSCSGCVVQSTTTAFPVDSIPLWTWAATGGIWDTSGIDQRATLAAGRRLIAGANSIVTQTGDALEIATSNYLPTGAVVSGTTLRLGGTLTAGQTLWGLGTSLSSGSGSGTYLGVNTSGGFAGDLAEWQVSGTRRFRWTAGGEYAGNLSGATSTWWGNAATATNSSFRLAIGGTAATEKLMLGTGASNNFLQANGLNRIGLGTAAPEPGTADLLIQDARATIGDTQVQIQAGAGQARDLFQVLTAGASVSAAVSAQGGLQLQTNGTRPACDATRRGTIWMAAGGAGVADQMQICQKTSADTYQWNP